MEKEKHTSSEVHHRADSGSVPACVSTGRSDMAVTIIGAASPILNVVPAANKDAAAHTTSDMRSCGVTLYVILTGYLLFSVALYVTLMGYLLFGDRNLAVLLSEAHGFK
ncbi:hypothetical protein Tco_0813584 [Tanacetum coccineum]